MEVRVVQYKGSGRFGVLSWHDNYLDIRYFSVLYSDKISEVENWPKYEAFRGHLNDFVVLF